MQPDGPLEGALVNRQLIGRVSEFQVGELKRVEVAGAAICVARTDEGFFAISDRCSHEGAQLSEGELSGIEIQCPLHSSRFDVRTGGVLGLPAQEPVESFRITLDGDQLFVTL
jgi:3-phenylpropionate/trans-cinnamate dioxygenase ferredoxin component